LRHLYFYFEAAGSQYPVGDSLARSDHTNADHESIGWIGGSAGAGFVIDQKDGITVALIQVTTTINEWLFKED